jgi:chromosome partitioning protein
MGFLSRKSKRQREVAVDEQHPIVEELQRMEEAVPERRDADFEELHPKAPAVDEQGMAASTAGPVADGRETAASPAGPVTEERGTAASSAGPVADATPTVLGDGVASAPRGAPASAPPPEEAADVVDEEDEGDGRMRVEDLIAPSRHAMRVAKVEDEGSVKHADVIAFANQKGGVAKTTTTLNLAVAFAESGYRVLCIDLDPQGNLTMSQGIDPDKVEKSLYDVLVNDMPISEIIVEREIDIAVASIDLAGAEIAMSTKIGRERSLEKALKEVSGEYDFVCIDTPPSLGLLTINALTAASKVIVPVQCEYLSMRGLVQLQNTLRMIQENLNPDVHIEGILPTMLDSRTVHAKEAVEILEENFGDLVFQSRIRKAIKFAEAPVKGSSVLKYDSGSSAANYYRELAKEVLANGSA